MDKRRPGLVLVETEAPGRRRRRLDRSQVVTAALELLDDVGLEGLSTRRLAERLGVQSPSLYWHVRDKEELLDLLADRIMSEVPVPAPDLPWRERLERLLTAGRRALRAHRDAARVLAGRAPRGPHWLEVANAAVGALVDAGLSDQEAVDGVSIVVSYLMGFALDEAEWSSEAVASYLGFLGSLSVERFPRLTTMAGILSRPDPDRQFHYGVGFLLDGLERRSAELRPASS